MSSDGRRASLISKDDLRGRQTGSPDRVHAVVSSTSRRRTKRTVIGAIEGVTVRGSAGDITVLGRIDTGAKRTSLDTDLAARAGLGPVLARVRTRAAAAERPEERDVVRARLVIRGKEFNVAVAVTDRKHMRYHMIVGMDVLRDSGFLIDPHEAQARAEYRATSESKR